MCFLVDGLKFQKNSTPPCSFKITTLIFQKLIFLKIVKNMEMRHIEGHILTFLKKKGENLVKLRKHYRNVDK